MEDIFFLKKDTLYLFIALPISNFGVFKFYQTPKRLNHNKKDDAL